MKADNTITAGELLTFSTGEYSDYTVHGVFRALRTFEVARTMREYVQEIVDGQTDKSEFYVDKAREWLAGEYSSPYVGNEDDYLAWLALHGYIVDEPSREIHVGAYGRLEIHNFEGAN